MKWMMENAWWREMAKRMAEKATRDEDWRQANRRLWCLSFVAGRPSDIDAEVRRDLVQDMLVRLQDPEVAQRLAEVDAPAHYVARMMRNQLTEQANRNRRLDHSARRHAEKVRRFQEQPDEEASRQEEAAKARFVVNHVLNRDDRRLLGWYYFRHLSAAQIAARLGVSEVTVWQRLVRARKRCKKALEE